MTENRNAPVPAEIPHEMRLVPIFNFTRLGDPVITWLAYAALLVVALSVTLGRSIIKGVQSDTSYISLVIVGAFSLVFIFSFVKASGLRREWKGTQRILSNDRSLPPGSEAERLVRIIEGSPRRNGVRFKDVVDAYYARLEVPLRMISVMSGIMVTLGLVGTILGLIVSVGGLESVMQNVGGSNSGLASGIQETIRGMAIAFYTTLLGAILGGIILRLLSISLVNSLVRISSELLQYLELTLPQSNPSEVGHVALASQSQLPVKIDPALAADFEKLSAAAKHAENELKKLSASTLDSRLLAIASQLEACVAAISEIRR